MAEKKKQHYVPRVYLRRFLADDIRFYLYNINNDHNIGLVSHKDQCYEDYFYGEDKIWENALSEKENKWNIAFEAVLSDDYSKIDDLREFAIFQLARTRAFNEPLTKSTARQYEEYLKSGLSGQGIKAPEELIKNVAVKKAEEITSPSQNLEMISKLSSIISDLAFVKIHYKTKNKLISSDNPVLLINPYLPPHVGLGMIGLIILFPLNPDNLAVFYDNKIYPRLRGKNNFEFSYEAEVKRLNALAYANADELIYSSVPIDRKTLSDSNKKLRNDNLKHDTVGILGPDNNKLIVTQQPTIYHNFSFSFASIDPFYLSVGRDFRDSVPRKYDEKWKDKEFMRCQDFFVDMIARSIHVDKEKYKRGYKAFYESILVYWGIKKI